MQRAQPLPRSPIGRSVGEIRPGPAIPEQDAPVGDAGVRAAALRVEGDALGPLNLVQELDLRPLQQIHGVSLGRDLGPGRHVDPVGLEVREARQGAVPERVGAAVQGHEEEYPGEHSGRRRRHRHEAHGETWNLDRLGRDCGERKSRQREKVYIVANNKARSGGRSIA